MKRHWNALRPPKQGEKTVDWWRRVRRWLVGDGFIEPRHPSPKEIADFDEEQKKREQEPK